jgi:hypothetical protein
LVIKSKDISGIRHDNPEYKKIICSLDIYEEIETTSDEFFDKMAEKLELKKFQDRNQPFGMNTQLIGSTKEYLYEMIHIDLNPKDTPVEIYNGVGNLLKMDLQHIFGNVIMLKTAVKVNNDITKIVDCNRKDLHDLLDSRINHLGVSVDDDGELNEFNWYYEDPSKFINEFMTQDHIHVERAFLKHNLQIYYTPGKKDNMKRLIDDTYDQMIIMTKLTDYFYGNFTLDEYNDIISLLASDCPLEIPEKWEEENKKKIEELKEQRRNFVFTKYKALWRAKQEYLNNSNKVEL